MGRDSCDNAQLSKPQGNACVISPAVWLAFCLCTVGNVCSSVGFKKFVQAADLEPTWRNLLAPILSPWAWLGLFGGVLFLLSYLFILRSVPVSVAFPIVVSFSTGAVVLVGVLFLGESIKPLSILGLAAIIGGVILVSR